MICCRRSGYDYSEALRVSAGERDSRVQSLIDESFEVRVLPLHEMIFAGESCNYCYRGSEDYKFFNDTFELLSALNLAGEFANKERFDVLDLGTGNGLFLQSLKDRYQNVSVMGISAADFRPTIHGNPDVKLSEGEYIVANIENLNKIDALRGRKFDLITSNVTVRHLSDPLRFVRDAYEMLQPNGILIFDEVRLNGISELAYANLFNYCGCNDVEIYPGRRVYKYNGESYFEPKAGVRSLTTIIRKTVEHLELPIYYDLENSTPASHVLSPDDDQAQIFYKASEEYNDWVAQLDFEFYGSTCTAL